jgi:hypothetical protein
VGCARLGSSLRGDTARDAGTGCAAQPGRRRRHIDSSSRRVSEWISDQCGHSLEPPPRHGHSGPDAPRANGHGADRSQICGRPYGWPRRALRCATRRAGNTHPTSRSPGWWRGRVRRMEVRRLGVPVAARRTPGDLCGTASARQRRDEHGRGWFSNPCRGRKGEGHMVLSSLAYLRGFGTEDVPLPS